MESFVLGILEFGYNFVRVLGFPWLKNFFFKWRINFSSPFHVGLYSVGIGWIFGREIWRRGKTIVGECKNYYCFVSVFLKPGWICSQISYFFNPYHYNVVLILSFFFLILKSFTILILCFATKRVRAWTWIFAY